MIVRPYKVETVVDGRRLSECFVSAHDAVHSTELGMVYCFFVLFSSF